MRIIFQKIIIIYNMEVSQSFQDNVRQWVHLNNKIKQAKKAISVIQKQKDALGDEVVSYIKANKIQDKVIGISDGKLQLQVKEALVPVNKEYIEERLLKYFKSADKAEEVLKFIYEDREKYLKESLVLKKK